MARHLKRVDKGRSLAARLSNTLNTNLSDLGLNSDEDDDDSDCVNPALNYMPAKKKKKKSATSSPTNPPPTEDSLEAEPTDTYKVKKKKKKKNKNTLKKRASPTNTYDVPSDTEDCESSKQEEEEEDVDKIVRDYKEKQTNNTISNPTTSSVSAVESVQDDLSSLFKTSAAALDADAELRKLFGNDTGVANTSRNTRNKKSLLVTPDDTWPPISAISGFKIHSFIRKSDITEYYIKDSGDVLKISKSVRSALASDDSNRLFNIFQENYWHLRAGYQAAVMMALTDRSDQATDIFRRLSHAIAIHFRGTLSLLDPFTIRVMPYREGESDVIFLILQQLMHAHVRTGCLGAAFELSKVC